MNLSLILLVSTLAIFAAQIDPGQSAAGFWWLPVAAYLLGSIPFGYLIVKLIGAGDIRFRGSGNIGATNVAREAGALPGLATLVLDGGKGYFSVWLAARGFTARRRTCDCAATTEARITRRSRRSRYFFGLLATSAASG